MSSYETRDWFYRVKLIYQLMKLMYFRSLQGHVKENEEN